MLQRIALGLLAAMRAATAVVGAHHGTLINYDRSKQWTAKAVVTEFQYVNPHAQLFFDVTDDKGNVTHCSGELLPNPAQLLRNGWTRKRSVEALQAGTEDHRHRRAGARRRQRRPRAEDREREGRRAARRRPGPRWT